MAKVEYTYAEDRTRKHVIQFWKYRAICGRLLTPKDIRRPITGLPVCEDCGRIKVIVEV